MRVVVVGLGVQGRKRVAAAGRDVVATADPIVPDARYRALRDVPLPTYDAAFVCTPDEAKLDLLHYLVEHGKHSLVEKPLLASDPTELEELVRRAAAAGVTCYTAYNHRFEPHIERMKDTIMSGALGRLYLCRLSYGNGTARDVRDSSWRDRGSGVLADLGSHLLDTALYWFGRLPESFQMWSANRFENRAYDHVHFGSAGIPVLEMVASLISWRNHFTADVYGEAGSAHIDGLCKWGRSTFTHRTRVLPSGRPREDSVPLEQDDPTWAREYRHFIELCRLGGSNIANDILLNRVLDTLARAALQRVRS